MMKVIVVMVLMMVMKARSSGERGVWVACCSSSSKGDHESEFGGYGW